jgi:tRNA A37 N6-isopentenylltransferase MiaA
VDFHSIQELICRNSRRYAKRQYTYFRGMPNATYFHAQDEAAVQEHIGKFLESSFPLLT